MLNFTCCFRKINQFYPFFGGWRLNDMNMHAVAKLNIELQY